MIEKLSNLFRSFSNAVIGIKNNEIVFTNPATQELLSKIEPGSRADIFFPCEVLEKCGSEFVASVNVLGRSMRISGSGIDDIGVFVLTPENGFDEAYSGILESINFQMRDCLSVLSMALGLLSSTIERLECSDLEGNMSIILHNYYKLSRINQNLVTYMDITKDCSASASAFSPKNTDIVTLLGDLTSTIRDLIKKQPVTVSFECRETSHIVAVDRSKFTQMILNLVSNSLKTTRSEDSVIISLKVSKGKIIIGVSDSGKGIPPNQLHTSLGKFAEEKVFSDTANGLGLGISLAARIAGLHGGSLLLESRESLGTSVKITIPDKVVNSDLLRENIMDTGSTGIHNIYTQLADVLPSEAYSSRYLD